MSGHYGSGVQKFKGPTRVITVRMPKLLHETLRDASKARQESMNVIALEALAEKLGVDLKQFEVIYDL